MPSCLEEALSAVWIGLTGHYRLTYEDKAMEAEDQLSRLMGQLDRREEALLLTKARCAEEALALRGSKDKARCRSKVLEHRRMAVQLQRLQSYRDTVAQHMDALQNTELNKSLISTLQESSRTLKSLGIVDGVKQAETVISDVHESMATVHELTSALGTPMGHIDIATDEELEQELNLLLEPEDAPRAVPARLQLSSPPSSVSMHMAEAEFTELQPALP